MKHRLGAICLFAVLSFACAAHAGEEKPAWRFAGTPAWQDEFDYTGKPDRTKWGYDTGGDGWGNHELQ